MASIPEEELEATRAALAPTLQAAADILPLLVKSRESRFDPEHAERWQIAGSRLHRAWSDRHLNEPTDLRPAAIELCASAIELNDPDCLRLAEALASVCDCLEDPTRREDLRLIAALTAAGECLAEPDGLDHPAFCERARHLAERLETACRGLPTQVRTATLDRLFAGEADERIHAMYEALELLPPDIYAIKRAAEDIADLAEPLELLDIIDRARLLTGRLSPLPGENIDLDDEATRNDVLARIALIEEAIADIRPPADDPATPGPIVF